MTTQIFITLIIQNKHYNSPSCKIGTLTLTLVSATSDNKDDKRQSEQDNKMGRSAF